MSSERKKQKQNKTQYPPIHSSVLYEVWTMYWALSMAKARRVRRQPPVNWSAVSLRRGPARWGPVYSSVTWHSPTGPSSSRRLPRLAQVISHLKTVTHDQEWQLALPAESRQWDFTWLAANQRFPKMVLISNCLTIILKNYLSVLKVPNILASNWNFPYPEAQFPFVSMSQFSVYGLNGRWGLP